MSKSSASFEAVLQPRNLRRRLLPLASSAALGLTGCMSAHPSPPATADLTSQQEAIQRVQNFTSGIDTAVDKADPSRVKMSAALNGAVIPTGAEKAQVVSASPQNGGAVPQPASTMPADVSNISHAPIATLTSVNQGISGVPASLGAMTAMGGMPQDRPAQKQPQHRRLCRPCSKRWRPMQRRLPQQRSPRPRRRWECACGSRAARRGKPDQHHKVATLRQRRNFRPRPLHRPPLRLNPQWKPL